MRIVGGQGCRSEIERIAMTGLPAGAHWQRSASHPRFAVALVVLTEVERLP